MDLDIQGQCAVITGGARGIGRAVTLGLAREGVNVIVCDIAREATERTAADASALGVKAVASITDVGDTAAVDAMISNAEKEIGQVDILVNNAGVRYSAADRPVGFKPLLETSRQDWNGEIGLILFGTINCMNAVVPAMRERKSGRIINFGSPAGRLGMAGMAPYGAAKAAVISLTRTAAMELAPYRITVNCVTPGFIASHAVSLLAEERDDHFAETEKQWLDIPLGGPGKPEYLSDMVSFLASQRAEWITGQIINVDGGQQMF